MESGDNRKKLSKVASGTNESAAGLAGTVVQKNFMNHVVVAAALAMLMLMYISTRDVTTTTKTQKPTTSKSVHYKSSSGSDVAPVTSPVTPPEASATPADTPVALPTVPADSPAESSSATGGAHPINKYSEFGKVEPLVNLPLPDDQQREALAEKFGKWNFWDGAEDMRPSEDFLADYPNRDCPTHEIPDDAWQADSVFVNHFLNDADALISRAKEAIYAEYGHAREGLTPEDIYVRSNSVFKWQKVDMDAGEKRPASFEKRGDKGMAGWISKNGYQGLVRRLLHAIMTSDTFTVVLAGHSVAAGAG